LLVPFDAQAVLSNREVHGFGILPREHNDLSAAAGWPMIAIRRY